MACCEKFAKCPFYQGEMKMDSGIGAAYRKKYCEGNFNECARHMVSTQVGPHAVTNALYPNMTKKAQEIIEKNKG